MRCGKTMERICRWWITNHRGKFTILFIILIMVNFQCSPSRNEYIFNTKEVDSILIVKYIDVYNEDAILVRDRKKIDTIINYYFNNYSEVFGKFPIEYGIVVFNNYKTADSIYLNGDSYKTKEIGSRKMEKNIRPYLDALFDLDERRMDTKIDR